MSYFALVTIQAPPIANKPPIIIPNVNLSDNKKNAQKKVAVGCRYIVIEAITGDPCFIAY